MVIDDDLFRAAHELSDEPFELLRPVVRDGRIADFVWEYVNPAGAELLEASQEAMIGRRLLHGNADEFNAARFAHWAELMEVGGRSRGEFSRLSRHGRRWYQTRSVRLDGRVAASSCDVTDMVRTLEAERATRERVLRAARTRDEFLVKLNHELRTPLNAISGWAHLVGRSDADAAMVQRAAETIGRNARAQAAIVDNLLVMNGIVSGTLGFDRQSCDVTLSLLAAIESIRPAADARWIEIHHERVAQGLTCVGDAERLEQVFAGLLDNAVRHTPLNGHIHVAGRREGPDIEIEIRDTGDGIAPEMLPVVFEMFEQGKTEEGSRSHGGLGLGLAIVRSLVELHGGKVTLHSEGLGQGTAARVVLPFREPAAGIARVPAGSERSSASDVSANGAEGAGARPDEASGGRGEPDALPLAWRRVLVLEDQADSLELVTVLLTQQGAIVRAFDSAEHALAAAEHGSFDLVISDLGMPGMDGLEFMQRLSRHPQPFKAIALTAYADDKYRAQALDAGFTRVVVKPIAPAHFLAVVLSELGLPGAPDAVAGP